MNLDIGKLLKCIEIISLATWFKWPFPDNAVWFKRGTDVCTDFQRLFWDEWAAGLAFVGPR